MECLITTSAFVAQNAHISVLEKLDNFFICPLLQLVSQMSKKQKGTVVLEPSADIPGRANSFQNILISEDTKTYWMLKQARVKTRY